MKAAVVHKAGVLPEYGDFQAPLADAGENRVTVAAAALSHLTMMRASGAHYSAAASFPFVAGVDGVGQLDGGERVYFMLPRAPFGSLAEQTVVAASQCVAVPDGLDSVMAAAIANPGMSSWAALRDRAHFQPGQTVLINGATGTSGRMAIQIARHLGAAKIIATGRNVETLKSLHALGADVTLSLTQPVEALTAALREQFAGGVDVVLDYLWGASAETILAVAAKSGQRMPMRLVQIGNLGAASINLPASLLRSSTIELMGSGLGSVSTQGLLHAIGEVFAAAADVDFRQSITVAPVPLAQVRDAWRMDNNRVRTVFVPG